MTTMDETLRSDRDKPLCMSHFQIGFALAMWSQLWRKTWMSSGQKAQQLLSMLQMNGATGAARKLVCENRLYNCLIRDILFSRHKAAYTWHIQASSKHNLQTDMWLVQHASKTSKGTTQCRQRSIAHLQNGHYLCQTRYSAHVLLLQYALLQHQIIHDSKAGVLWGRGGQCSPSNAPSQHKHKKAIKPQIHQVRGHSRNQWRPVSHKASGQCFECIPLVLQHV